LTNILVDRDILFSW